MFGTVLANSAENSESLLIDDVNGIVRSSILGKTERKKHMQFLRLFDSFLMCKQSTPTNCQLALASTKTVAVS